MSSLTGSPASAKGTADCESSQHHGSSEACTFEVLPEQKKKKRNNNRGRVAKKWGTGFEEYYCDAPLTPAQHEGERNSLYPAHRPFVERIEECIQRFRATRHMDSTRSQIFSRYLILGGVDAYPRQFSGISGLKDEDLEDRTKAELRTIAADDVIQRGAAENTDPRFYNPNNPEHWEVDFAGVAAGFFSDEHNHEGGKIEIYRMAAEVVSNFLKYVDRHDVCPEYAADIRNALHICDLAVEEKPLVVELAMALPGSFNMAATMLFSRNQEVYEFDNATQFDESMDENRARIIFGVNLAIQLELEHGQRTATAMARGNLAVTETVEKTLEVVSISLPDGKRRARYAAVNKYLAGKMEIEACGSVAFRPATVPNGVDNSSADVVSSEPTEEVVLILEESILKFLKIGMKIKLMVCTLNEGIKFIKFVKEIYPTFYAFLPQQLMLHYKEPALYNRRAPNVHDDDGEGGDVEGAQFGEEDHSDE